MSGILDFLKRDLGARITSTSRNPNSALGRANPRSYHNIGQAVDVAPIPGLSFEQYVGKLKAAGYQILEARDEVTNPSRHATGPHWHVAYSKAGGTPDFTPQQHRYARLGATMQQPMPLPQDMLDQPSVMSNPGPLASLIQQGPMNIAPMDDIQAPKPKAFDKGGKGWVIAGIIADAIAGGFGGKGGFAPTYTAIQEDERQLAAWREKVAAERAERMRPQVREVGGALGMVDPQTGAFTPTYQAPARPTGEAGDLAWWQSLSPEQRQAFLAMKDAISPIAVGSPEGGYSRVPRQMGGRQAVRTGTDANGRKVVQYNDGSIDYAD